MMRPVTCCGAGARPSAVICRGAAASGAMLFAASGQGPRVVVAHDSEPLALQIGKASGGRRHDAAARASRRAGARVCEARAARRRWCSTWRSTEVLAFQLIERLRANAGARRTCASSSWPRCSTRRPTSAGRYALWRRRLRRAAPHRSITCRKSCARLLGCRRRRSTMWRRDRERARRAGRPARPDGTRRVRVAGPRHRRRHRALPSGGHDAGGAR